MVSYSTSMASSAQASTHIPQSVHVSASMTASSLTNFIDSSGHCSIHSPQPVHFSTITFAGILISPYPATDRG